MASSQSSPDTIHWEGRGVRADHVAAQLLRLRTAAADEDGFPLARASVMNLITYAASPTLAAQAVSMVDELAMRHPSRAIIIAPATGRNFSLDAEVVLHRHPLALHGLVYERVLLRPQGGSPEGLDTLVIPLLIPHLQSFVWWLGDPDPADPAMRSLVSISDRLVVDSSLGRSERLAALASHFTGPPQARIGTSAPRLVLGDMAWSRLEPLRETLAGVFDEANRARYLDNVELFEVTGGTRGQRDRVTSNELLFAGWVCARLGYSQPVGSPDGVTLQSDSSGRRTLFAFKGSRRSRSTVGSGTRVPLRGFRLVARAASRRLEVELRANRDEGELVIRENQAPEIRRTVPLSHHAEAEALSHELDRMGRDRVYEDALLSAARIDAVVGHA